MDWSIIQDLLHVAAGVKIFLFHFRRDYRRIDKTTAAAIEEKKKSFDACIYNSAESSDGVKPDETVSKLTLSKNWVIQVRRARRMKFWKYK